MIFSKLSQKHLPLLSLWYEVKETTSQQDGKLPLAQWVSYVNNTPNYFSWIVYKDYMPIGNIALEIDSHTQSGHVSILPSPYLHGMGYEELMLQELFQRAELQSTHTVQVWLEAQHTPSVRLFQKLEFIRQSAENSLSQFVHSLA